MDNHRSMVGGSMESFHAPPDDTPRHHSRFIDHNLCRFTGQRLVGDGVRDNPNGSDFMSGFNSVAGAATKLTFEAGGEVGLV